MRLAFIAPPFAGHLYPLIQLAEAARTAGHQVEFVSGEAKRAVVEGKDFPFASLPSLAGHCMENVANTPERVGSNPWRLLKQLRQALALSIKARQELYELWRTNPPDLVVADSVAIIAGLVADELHIPWITTAASPLVIECRRGVPSYLGGWKERNGRLYSIRDALGRFLVRNTKLAIAFFVRDQLRELGGHVYRPDGSEAAYSPYAILGFGLEELEFERDWPQGFQMIGPAYLDPEPDVALTFPENTPRVLVTFGTHLPWAKAKLADDIIWLASQRPSVTFVASLGAPEQIGEAPQRLASNAMLFPFISYAKHLDAFDTVIHHGGAGVTYASIAKGKPAIVVPQDYDQFDYAARITAKGAGLCVAKLRSRSTLAALDAALIPNSFPALPKLAASCRNPAADFLQAIERVLTFAIK